MRTAVAGLLRVLGVLVGALALGVDANHNLTRVVSAAPLSASALFADATSRDETVRQALDDRPVPAMSRAVKSALASYESLVRHYPTSGYSDDALWRAAQLAIHAAARLKQPSLQAYAERYLTKLQSAYPSSKYAKQAPELRATLATTARARVTPETPAPGVAPPAAAPAPRAPEVGTSETTPAPMPAWSQAHSSPVARPRPDLSPPSGRSPARLLALHRTVLPDVVRVTLDVDREVPFRQERLSGPARIFFDLANTTSARSLADRTVRFEDDGDVVRQIRIGQPAPDTLRVVLDATGVASCHASPLYSPYRLVVDCVREARSPIERPSRPKPLTPGTFARKSPSPERAPGAARPRTAPTARASTDLVPPVSLTTASAPASSVAPAPVTVTPTLIIARVVSVPWTATLPSGPARMSAETLATLAAASAEPPQPLPARAHSGDTTTIRPPAPNPSAVAKRDLGGGFSLARQLGLQVSRIVIDPGHGGHDPGAKGPGITEAALVLDIALRLEALLQAEGVEVVLTRRADEFVTLETRTAIANQTAADLFLSIHANASNVPQAAGVETYYLDFAHTASAAAVAARENAASGQSMNALPDIVKAIALNGKQDESRDFATQVQRALVQKLSPSNGRLRDLGVKRAPFVVLIGASMPSVLAEVSFVTNEQEARLLKGQSYRQRIAEALFTAVQRYQESLARPSRVTGQ